MIAHMKAALRELVNEYFLKYLISHISTVLHVQYIHVYNNKQKLLLSDASRLPLKQKKQINYKHLLAHSIF